MKKIHSNFNTVPDLIDPGHFWHHGLLARLEPRVMFDGAAAQTVTEVCTGDTDVSVECLPLDHSLVEALDSGCGKEIAVIDTSVKDYTLLADTAVAAGMDIIYMNPENSGVATLVDQLTGQNNIDALHIFSHGTPGKVFLGSDTLSLETLPLYKQSLQIISSALNPDGDILLYGCRVGDNQVGLELIQELAVITQADIAASDDLTASQAGGGDWDLEVQTGNIEAHMAFNEKTLSNFSDRLGASFTIDFTSVVNTAGSEASGGNPNPGVDAKFGHSSYPHIVVANGTTASTRSYNAGVQAGSYHNNIDETLLTFSLQSGATFDAYGIYIYNYSNANETFFIESDNGHSLSFNLSANGTTTRSFNFTNITELRIRTSDGGFTSIFDNLQIGNVVTNTNSAPTISGTPSSATITEDTATGLNLAAVSVADSDGDQLTMTLTVDAGSFSSPADGSGVGSGVTESLVNSTTITLVGSAADINTYLDTTGNITYQGAANAAGNNSATLTIAVSDGSANLASNPDMDIHITAVNDNPTISGLPSDVTVSEDAASDVDLSAASLADVDTTDADFTLTIAAGAGTLSAVTGGGVTVSGSGTSSMTLTGTVSNIDTFLNTSSNIQYTGANNVNGNNATTLSLTANDQDGSGNVSLGSVNVDISAVNDNPTATGLPSDISFTEDTAASLDLSAVTLADVDSSDPDFVLTLAASTGTLSAVSGGNVTVSGSGSGTLTLTGTVSNIDTYLNTSSNIQYTPGADVSGDNAATLTITGNDQDGSGNHSLGTVNLDMAGVNDNPAIASLPSDVTVSEDTASNVDLSAASLTDVDSTGSNFTLTLAAGAGTLTANSGGGVTVSGSGTGSLVLTGTVSNIDTFLNTASNIQYTGTAEASGDDVTTLTLTANDQDGSGNLNLGSVNVDISAVNDNPTATGVPSDISFTEDTAAGLDLSAITLGDVDSSDPDFTLVLVAGTGTLSSASGGSVTVSGSGTGTLTLTGTVANIDAFLNNTSNIQYTPGADVSGDNATTLTLTGNDQDGSGNVSLGTVNLDITGVNDNPALASLPSDVTVTEDTASNVDLSAASLTDVDSTGSNFSLTLAAGAGTLTANSGGGVTVSGSGTGSLVLTGTVSNIDTFLNTSSNIQYTGAADANGNNVTTITLTANDQDGSGNLNLGSTNVDINAVNDNPTLSGLVSDVTVSEDTASDVDLSAVSLADVDSTGANFTLTLAAGTGTLTALSAGGVTVSGSGTGTLTLTGTVSNIDTFLNTASNVQYTGPSNVNGNNVTTITLTANDQDGSGNVNLGSTNVDINDVNDNPTATGIPSDVTVTEDAASDVDLSGVTLADTDSTGANFTLTLAAGAGTLAANSGGSVTVSGSGTDTLTLTGTVGNIDTFLNTANNIQYTGAADANGNDVTTLTITANDQDGSGNLTLGTVNMDITNVSDDPVGTDVSFSTTVGETKTFAIADFGFTDVDTGDALNRVQIDTLNLAYGTLTLSGTAVAAGDWITSADIPNLVYTATDAGNDSFTFIVEDDSAANAQDSSAKTVTLANTAAQADPNQPTYIPPSSLKTTIDPHLPQTMPPISETPGNFNPVVEPPTPPEQSTPAAEPASGSETQAQPLGAEPTDAPEAPQSPQPETNTRETVEVDAQGNIKFSNAPDVQTNALRISSMEVNADTNTLEIIIQNTEGTTPSDAIATMPDGSPLPQWLSFDAQSGTLTGKPPQGTDSITLKITSTDAEGKSVVLEVEIKFDESRQASPTEGQGNDNALNTQGLEPLPHQFRKLHMLPPEYGNTLIEALV